MSGTVDDWLAEVAMSLGVDVSVLDEQSVLDLARDAAHHVARPAAPLTTFLVGYAAGTRAASMAEAVRLSSTISELARAHAAPE
ncbi:MAG: DUF6457 domain-containing protein [Actinomycetes bacterium]